MKIFCSTALLFLSAPSFILAQTNQVTATKQIARLPPATNSAPAATLQVDPFDDPLIKQVQARHEKAYRNDTKETKALTTDLEKWTREQPDNHLLQAYLGSVYTLDSRDAWPGPGKLTYLKNGGKLLDAAVTAAPGNPAVRFVRAIDYFMLPSIFGKRQTARDDFQVLLKQIDGTTQSSYVLSLETQQAICYYAGLSSMQLSHPAEAKTAWLLGYKLGPTTDLGKQISNVLAKVK